MKIKDKEFKSYISHQEIADRVAVLGKDITKKYEGKKPLFIVILNGSFVFAADLLREVNTECDVTFIRLASYSEMQSTGSVKELIGLTENIFNRHVIVVEDIVDTGTTLEHIYDLLQDLGPASIEVATLLYKPEAYKKDIGLKFIGFEIPNKFVLGYGLDYDGVARNLKDVYQLAESE
ncbi:MAG: hypoxanthine phosphoribosyltransferase [Cytophagales bacterium]|nr:hypoxanthine phosphoribosyltransferase [Cytophagales bacterium]